MIALKLLAAAALLGFADASSCSQAQSADDQATQEQSVMEQQALDQVGLPNIVNFREKRTLKLVEELADQAIPTYSYVFNPFQGCFVFIGPTFGYPIPYATQYTNPMKTREGETTGEFVAVPQADPNGLFKPSSAAGTWVLMRDNTGNLSPQYIEDNVDTFTFKLPNDCSSKK